MPRKTFTYEGKRIDLTAKTQEELDQKIGARKEQMKRGIKAIKGNETVASWGRRYLVTYKSPPKVSKAYYRDLCGYMEKWIIPFLGNRRLKDIEQIDCQECLNQLTGMSSSLIDKVYNLMSDMFKKAKSNKKISDNPMEDTEKPKPKKSEPGRPLTDVERKYILEVAQTHRAGLWIKIMLYCGLRPGETIALQWKSIDFNEKVMFVDSAVKSDGLIGGPKSEAGVRLVPIPGILLGDLLKIKGDPFEYILTKTDGTRHNKESVRRMWETFVHDLNVAMGCRTFRNQLVPPFPVAKDLVPYCMRHTYGTDLQAAGVPINVAKELMGHSKIETTSKIYTHWSKKAFQSAAENIENFHSAAQ